MSLLSRYQKLGERFDPTQINIRPALRVNTLKISEKEIIKRLAKKEVKLEKIPFLECGYWYKADFSLGSTPEYLQGYYYLQEAASQLPVVALDLKADQKILDMASAPGSKTTQIAQAIQNKGVIVALDSDANRLQSLKNNVERLGASCVVTYKKDARFATDLGLMFDKVLLDAPCSGNFCIEENFFSKRTIEDIRQRARLQKDLLKSAYKVLKNKGTLVYSTCSLEPEENELVIDWFLEKYPDMSIVETNLKVGDSGLTSIFGQAINKNITKAKRLWPHKTQTQGFFIAKMVKN